MGPDGLAAIEQIGTQYYCKAELNKSQTPEQMEVLRKLIRAAQRKKAPPLPPQQTIQPGPAMAPDQVQGVGSPMPAMPPQPQG
jgi:hypothetical protein